MAICMESSNFAHDSTNADHHERDTIVFILMKCDQPAFTIPYPATKAREDEATGRMLIFPVAFYPAYAFL
jgi:hypothetical protein